MYILMTITNMYGTRGNMLGNLKRLTSDMDVLLEAMKKWYEIAEKDSPREVSGQASQGKGELHPMEPPERSTTGNIKKIGSKENGDGHDGGAGNVNKLTEQRIARKQKVRKLINNDVNSFKNTLCKDGKLCAHICVTPKNCQYACLPAMECSLTNVTKHPSSEEWLNEKLNKSSIPLTGRLYKNPFCKHGLLCAHICISATNCHYVCLSTLECSRPLGA